MSAPRPNLDLGLVGNGSFGVLVDDRARIVWGCVPAFDGDPAFCALLQPKREGGDWAIELVDGVSCEQHYLANTAVLRTVLHDVHGSSLEIIDFAPRWKQNGRRYPTPTGFSARRSTRASIRRTASCPTPTVRSSS